MGTMTPLELAQARRAEMLANGEEPEPKKPTPKRIVREYCIDCIQTTSYATDCGGAFLHITGKECPLYQYWNKPGKVKLKPIREECVKVCMGGSFELVKNCQQGESCPLYPYRMGKDPFRKPLSEEQKTVVAERMRELRKMRQCSSETQEVNSQSNTQRKAIPAYQKEN